MLKKYQYVYSKVKLCFETLQPLRSFKDRQSATVSLFTRVPVEILVQRDIQFVMFQLGNSAVTTGLWVFTYARRAGSTPVATYLHKWHIVWSQGKSLHAKVVVQTFWKSNTHGILHQGFLGKKKLYVAEINLYIQLCSPIMSCVNSDTLNLKNNFQCWY